MRSTALAFFFTCTMFAAPAYALDPSQIRAGADYFYDRWNDNVRVRVLEVRGNSVEIMYMEGENTGLIDVVAAADILTLSESEQEAAQELGESIGIGVGIGVLALCAFTDSCQSGDESIEIVFENNCHEETNLAIAYTDLNGQVSTEGWWTFQPDQRSMLNGSNGQPLIIGTREILFYAEGESHQLEGPNKVTFDGRSLGMAPMSATSGDVEFSLTC